MPANVYECMFLLDSTKVAGDLPAAVKQLHAVLERNQAEILASRPWEPNRKLAYPIRGQKKGDYYLTYFRTEGKNVDTIERDFKLVELVMRMLVLKIDPKLVDIMLQLARDEHAVALQTVTEPPEDELGGRDGDDMDRGPRRGGGRRSMEMADK
jgi:small subunit ribosomal protein S6